MNQSIVECINVKTNKHSQWNYNSVKVRGDQWLALSPHSPGSVPDWDRAFLCGGESCPNVRVGFLHHQNMYTALQGTG